MFWIAGIRKVDKLRFFHLITATNVIVENVILEERLLY